jgi:ribonuclease VapC
MLVIDSSALIAIMFGEASAQELSAIIASHTHNERMMSVANYLEVGTVLAGRRTSEPLNAIVDLEAILSAAAIRLEPVDENQARIALDARIRFGKGFGARAGLNFGDSFAYALAKGRNAPLLFTGDDFSATDIQSARS